MLVEGDVCAAERSFSLQTRVLFRSLVSGERRSRCIRALQLREQQCAPDQPLYGRFTMCERSRRLGVEDNKRLLRLLLSHQHDAALDVEAPNPLSSRMCEAAECLVDFCVRCRPLRAITKKLNLAVRRFIGRASRRRCRLCWIQLRQEQENATSTPTS